MIEEQERYGLTCKLYNSDSLQINETASVNKKFSLNTLDEIPLVTHFDLKETIKKYVKRNDLENDKEKAKFDVKKIWDVCRVTRGSSGKSLNHPIAPAEAKDEK